MISEVLSDNRIGRLIELALMEDIGMGDITSEAIVDSNRLGKGSLHCKEDGIVAGLEVAALVFQYCDHSLTLDAAVVDGAAVGAQTILGTVDGQAKAILKGERTALNFLQRMSGIATLTRHYVEAVKGTSAKIIDTRKTAPGLRVLDKWAVRIGGGENHRFGLDDMVLIKENHIAAAGGISRAIERCKQYIAEHAIDADIEIETTSLADVQEALAVAGIKRIMLDNFPLDDMAKAVQRINRQVEVEASGGVTLHNVRAIAETGVDVISVGALTHSVRALDISLELSHATHSP